MSIDNESLISLIKPEPNSTVMIYDVHASESGALAILNDLYNQIREYSDKSVKWIFIVSTPEYQETENITVKRFPWVKKNWGYRFVFDNIFVKSLLREFKTDHVFSLQNKGVPYYKNRQSVYLHLPFILTDHKFNIRTDGKKLWMYQNIISKSIFRSLRKVDMTIVQTQWMKDALVKKGGVSADRIVIQQPDVSTNNIGKFIDNAENRKRFFYPATAFTYKNHITLLKALKQIQDQGYSDYELFLTIKPDENKLTEALYKYAADNNLNVVFNGPISREEVFERYTNSVLIFPSYVESFGLPLLEARLSDTYVLASNCSFSREILEGYDKASFFEETDHKQLSKCISNVIR